MATRPGFALVAVIVCLALLEAAVISLITVASHARIMVEDEAAAAAARVGAESAIRKAIAEWDEAVLGFPAVGSRFFVPWARDSTGVVRYSVEAERLFRGVYLLTGNGWVGASGPSGVRAVAAATVASIPSAEFWLDFHSAVVAGSAVSLTANASIDATSPSTPAPPLQPADCMNPGPAAPMPVGFIRPGIAFGGAAALSGPPAVPVAGAPPVLPFATRAAPADFLRFGRLPITDVAAIADHVLTGTVSLASRSSAGVCDTSAIDNWGAPGNRMDPCFDWLPLVYAPGSLTITSGEGQGILVVHGDLTLGSGTRFIGPVLVTGKVETGGTELHGALRVGSPGSSIGGLVRFDECALTRAFTRGRAMRRVYRHEDRLWLPPF